MKPDLARIAAFCATLALGAGCGQSTSSSSTSGPTATTATASAKPPAAAPQKPAPGPLGSATLKGAVAFTGKAPEMKVPAKRKAVEGCNGKEVPYNAVVIKNGKLADVLVRLVDVKGYYEPPTAHAEINQADCMYTPRIQGVVAGQTIDIKNGDAVTHSVHPYRGAESWFNIAQTKGSTEPISKEIEDPGIIKFTCDMHPWMRAFVVASTHPFFAVTKEDGSFAIEKVPAGKFEVEAFHPIFGRKTKSVEVAEGKAIEVAFTFDASDPEPPENRDELKDLF